eukprot:6212777-Pleurochrysis_carterae.AAC.2
MYVNCCGLRGALGQAENRPKVIQALSTKNDSRQAVHVLTKHRHRRAVFARRPSRAGAASTPRAPTRHICSAAHVFASSPASGSGASHAASLSARAK